MPVNAKKDFPHRVFSVLVIPEQSTRHSKDGPVEKPHQMLERRQVTGLDESDEPSNFRGGVVGLPGSGHKNQVEPCRVF